MDHLVTGESRPRGRGARALVPWAVLSLTLPLMLTGCSDGAGVVAAPEARAGTHPFLSSNDLMYPPELWGSLERSTVSSLLRHQLAEALGEEPTWTTPLAESFAAASVELPGVEAAFLIQDSGLLENAPPPWDEQDINDWWQSALDEDSVDHMWMAAELAGGHGTTIRPSAAAVDMLRDQVASRDILPADLATDLLARFAPSELEEGDAAAERTNVRTPRDAAQILLREAEGAGISTSDTHRQLLTIAEGGVEQDDWTRAYLVRAYTVAGRPDDARRVAGTWDERRLLADGAVLEPPVFSGSVGSTFRMLQLLDPEGSLELDQATRARIAHATRELLDEDLSHRVAGTAVLHLLDPEEIPAARRADVIATAAATEWGTDGPLSLQEAVAWTALSSYAVAMDTEFPFPGLSADAIREWTAEEDRTVAPSILRLVLALQETDQLRGQEGIAPLLQKVQALLAGQSPEAVDSMLLFGGSLAVWAATGQWPYDEATLRRELEARQGNCLGGFDGFVREASTPGAYCNVDSTRYALALERALDGGQP